MASYASKVRSNQDLKAAARSLGMKPSAVKTRGDMKSVRREAKSRAGSYASTQQVTPSSSQQNQLYTPATVGGNFVGSSLGIVGDFLGKYGKNETVAGLGAGTIFDIAKTQANTGLGIAYNDAFLGSLGNYQSGIETLRTANAGKLMAQEGAIARDLTDLQTGRALEGLKYGSDKQLEGLKYGSDKQLEGTKYGYDSQERQIGLTGREERQTLQQKTTEERKLRADARGAIRSQGARFYA